MIRKIDGDRLNDINLKCSVESDEMADSSEIATEINNDGCFYVNYNGKVYCCITIIGQIEGHYILNPENKTTKYEHLIPKIISADSNNGISGLMLILNTVGGDIEAGLAIAELIAGMKKPTVSLVLGGGHSIGIPLAVSAVKSFITKTATMTIHPARMNGLVMGVPQQLAYFQNMQERIISFVSEHSSVSSERFREMMMASGQLVSDFGTTLNGEEAVNEGIIDAIGTICDAFDAFDSIQ